MDKVKKDSKPSIKEGWEEERRRKKEGRNK